MSLFICDECGCVENTSLCNWACKDVPDLCAPGQLGRALCSACDPSIGAWHGQFPQEKYDPVKDRGQAINNRRHR